MYKYLLLVLITFSSFSLYACEDEHLSLALEVVKIPEGEKLDELINSLVNSQIRVNPSVRPIRKAFNIFYREVFTSDEFKYGLARIQMDLFTYDELLLLKELMNTPIFKKYEDIMPQFLSKNMELGSLVVKNNEKRLMELIEKERNHIEILQQLDKELMLTVPE
ncbi:MAG: hypothetical protein COB62_00080 [Piscirickettsiaceae bacterium]|nr:MAG: hypothetical protein COB62_00080 [Piscirickettsiaceae bacterium]